MKVGPSWWDTWLYKRMTEVRGKTGRETELSVWAEDRPPEDSVRRKPSASQKLNNDRLWSGLSSFPSCEKRNFCCLKYRICRILLGQPKQIKTFLQNNTFLCVIQPSTSLFTYMFWIGLHDGRSMTVQRHWEFSLYPPVWIYATLWEDTGTGTQRSISHQIPFH